MQEKLKPSTQRMRLLNERRKAGFKLPTCKCGAKCTSPEGIKLQLCSACRRATPEGRKRAIDNAYKSMHRRAKLFELEVPTEGFEWTWQEADRVLPNHTNEVLTETIRGAKTTAIYYPEYGWVDTVDGATIKVKRWAEIPDSEAS